MSPGRGGLLNAYKKGMWGFYTPLRCGFFGQIVANFLPKWSAVYKFTSCPPLPSNHPVSIKTTLKKIPWGEIPP